MLKKLFSYAFISLFLTACGNDTPVEQADNGLDGGRNFIESYMQGDIQKAQLYLVEDPENQAYFDKMSTSYFSMDKEGRNQFRQASIQINEVKTVNAQTTIIYYQNSFEKIPRWLKVVSTPKGWKVDLKYSYGPKL
jgi:hypothetical protein